MTTHAKRSPSAAHRWLRCPGSIPKVEALRAAGKIPAESSSAYTDEGKQAHDLVAQVLRCYDLLGVADYSDIHDAVMAAHLRTYVDEVLSDITADGQLHIEEPVALFYSPNETGTPDAWVLTDEALIISDLKYGQGVVVEARENEQLMIYAWSILQQLLKTRDLPDQFDVKLRIVQPRVREGDPIKVWPMTVGELRGFAEDLSRVSGDKCFAGEKQCRFCPAKGQCEEHARWSLGSLDVRAEFGDVAQTVEATAVSGCWGTLSDDQLVRIAQAHLAGYPTKFLDAVVEALQARAERGETFPGMKLVLGEKRRVWTNIEEARKRLKRFIPKEHLETVTLVTPPQALKLLPKDAPPLSMKRIEALIEKPIGAPQLVLESDRRPTHIPQTPEQAFADCQIL